MVSSSFFFSASSVGLAPGGGATVDGATGGEPPRVGAILGRLGGGAVEEEIEEPDREAVATEAAAAAADLPPGCISFEPEEARES